MLSKRSLKDLMNDENCSCALYERIEEAQRKAKEKQEYFSLAFLDLGHLKEVNACFDYDLADRLLVDVAERLMSCLGSGESLCHFSGDRFIIILNADDNQKAAIKAITILGVIKNTFNILSYQLKISACLGITTYNLEEKSPFKLIREGELALQHAKRKGHNTWSLFNEAMQDSVNINYQIRNELHFAIEKQELWLAYQPLVNVSDLMPVGFETLLRWNKPELNNPPPALFIPPAEENGLIIELGDWVIDQAIQQLKSWEATKQCGKFLSVNVSACQFWDEDFYERIFEKVQYQKIDPSHIEFEITESTAMRDLDKSHQVIKKLNNLGFSIAIDDFGTGYSSLAYLVAPAKTPFFQKPSDFYYAT